MQPTNRTARLAGALYVLVGATAPFSLLYVPGMVIVKNNPAATAQKVLAAETMFRLGIVCELATATTAILLVMVLYRLLNNVNRMQAALMVILGAVVSAPISYLNVLNEIAALNLLHGNAGLLAVFNQPQREALALFFLNLHGQGLIVVQIFWGLWLIPFGLLVMRSRFLPKILGILLLVNAVPYLLISVTALLGIPYMSVLNKWALIPELGEVWIMLWLLIKGAKVEGPSLPQSGPQHRHHFSQHEDLPEAEGLALVLRDQQAGKAERQPRETRENQPHTENPRKETRPINEHAEGMSQSPQKMELARSS